MAITRIDVKTKSVQDLMDPGEIPSGRYWLPSFQREFVWDADRIRQLLDSIFRNYPIGSVILWKPSSRNATEVDPTAVPLMNVASPVSREPHLVIDGQQRLTSLLLVFNGWRLQRGTDGKSVSCAPIAYEPGRDRFIISEKRGHDFSKIVRAFIQNDLDALNELRGKTLPSVFEQMKQKARKLLTYSFSQYILETDVEDSKTFADMANAFIRINKEGVKIGNVELMLSFVAGVVGGDIKQRIRILDEEFKNSFSMAPQPTIRFVFSNFGLSQTQLAKVQQFEPNIKRINSIPQDQQESIFKTSATALRNALKFLDGEFGIRASQFLPSQNTLVPLAAYFHHRKLEKIQDVPPNEVQQILRWFILANFHGVYSASADTRLNRDIKIIRESESFPYEHLMEAVSTGRRQITYDDLQKGLKRNVLKDAGRAYLFLLYILLVRRQADDWSDTLLKARQWSELQKHHIFPQEYLHEKLEIDEADDEEENTGIRLSNLGNITFVNASVNAAIGATPPDTYLPEYLQYLSRHFIPGDDAYWTLEAYKSKDFQNWRVREMYLEFRKQFPEIASPEEPPPIVEKREIKVKIPLAVPGTVPSEQT